MVPKFYVSNNSYVPSEFEDKNLREKICEDPLVIKRFFASELFGDSSILVDYYNTKAFDIKYREMPGVDRSKMSPLERMLYVQKKNKCAKEAEIKAQEIKELFELIHQQANAVLHLCSKYEMNLDGTFKDGSKYDLIQHQLFSVGDVNVKREFVAQVSNIRQELSAAYQSLRQNAERLYTHEIYFQNSSLLYSFSYSNLTDVRDDGTVLLDKILNEKIGFIGNTVTNSANLTYDYDFEQESINIAKKSWDVYREIDFLKKSGYLQDNELSLLMNVEKAYDEMAISENRISYMKNIIISLGNDQRFVKMKAMLNKQLEIEKEKHQKLSIDAQEKYEKYDVKSSVELVQKRKENDVALGNSPIDRKQSQKSGDLSQMLASEDRSQRIKYERVEIRKRTIMAQYLRERAFKTQDGKLSFSQYVAKYSSFYDLDESSGKELIDEMGKSYGRKL